MVVKFEELYGSEAQAQKARYQKLREGFQEAFGELREASFFSAPGRTEIGGNHTDHNHGRVLTAAVNLDVAGVAQKTDLPKVA